MWLYDPLPVLHTYRVMWFTFVLIAVGACTPVNIKPVATNCFPTVTYTAEFQNAAADELDQWVWTDLDGAPNHRVQLKTLTPHNNQYAIDYGAERKALKACAQ